MKAAAVLTAACLAILTGCAVGPDYHPPRANVPAQWSSPLANGETNAPVDLAAWWKQFSDTNLDALVSLAVQSNLTLQLAEARVREARAEQGVVAGGLWPSLGTAGSYSRNRWARNNFPPLPPGTA